MAVRSPTTTPQRAEDGTWSSEASAKVRRPRASRPKTRTGCRTCKIRRVKCDETKPSCLRCLKFHGECDGFGYNTKSTPPANTKILLPKPQKQKLLLKIESQPPQVLSVHDFQPSLFTNEQEHSSFRYFHDKTARRLSGYFDEASMWNRLVLQACESDQSIRHAVIAIGALDMALDTAQVRKRAEWLEPAKVQLQAESQRHFALNSYGKAIKRMRDSLSEPRRDMRNILIACLLFVAFESFHGNNNSAVQQAHGGIKLLNGWLPQWVPKAKDPETSLKGLRSPAPHIIEDELVQAFARLDWFTISSLDIEPVQIHPLLKSDILEILRLMPETFWDIEEARMYFDLLWRQVRHFIHWVYGWGRSLGYHTKDIKDPLQSPAMCHGPKKAFIEQLNKNPEMQSEAHAHIEAFEKWAVAFDPLYHQSRTPTGMKDFTAATVLRLHSKAGYYSISGAFMDPLEYDKRHAECTEILDLAQVLTDTLRVQETGGRATFMVDGPLSGSIYIVVLNCRDTKIRRRAIKLLESQPRREGIWDSVLTARISRLIMNIEEKGLEGDFIPETARMNNIRTSFNMQERKGTLTYTWLESLPGKGLEVMREDFTW